MALASREEQRSVIRFLAIQGEPAAKIHAKLVNVYGSHAISDSAVRKWKREFAQGMESVQDLARAGRPRTMATATNAAKVEEMVMANRRMTVQEISEGLNISHGSVLTILHDHLNMTKVSSRWVPKKLTDDQKACRVNISEECLRRYQEEGEEFLDSIVTEDESWFPLFSPESKRQSMQWKHKDSPPPTKCRALESQKKVLYAVFWDAKGIILAYPVPEGTTISGETYTRIIRDHLLPAIAKRRAEKARGRFILHQDNAPPHRALVVRAALQAEGIEVLKHPPYSPDLAPSDYWLFAAMKNDLRGRRFGSRSALGSAIYQYGERTPSQSFRAAIQDLVKRWGRCVCLQGEFVEP